MQQKIEEIRLRALNELKNVSDSKALDELRVKILGKKGELTGILRSMGQVAADLRPKVGQWVNETRESIENAINEAQKQIAQQELERKLESEKLDVTLPVEGRSEGSLHPMSLVLEKLFDIFTGMGFEAVEGPEVEYDHYNFELMNIPKNHPARDAQDTFYVDDNIVLRTHTSPVQARIMTTRKPPIRIVSFGRVYRADEADATHSPVFHQMEGLVIDENITMGDLKGT
ncbi:MAG: phenylalanine--tRNA ligase subunit alpha, partial [Clostridia bacterium]|nr:phenylalanine--tRNA ligase subunit alpha [Clostridia bacterium]